MQKFYSNLCGIIKEIEENNLEKAGENLEKLQEDSLKKKILKKCFN